MFPHFGKHCQNLLNVEMFWAMNPKYPRVLLFVNRIRRGDNNKSNTCPKFMVQWELWQINTLTQKRASNSWWELWSTGKDQAKKRSCLPLTSRIHILKPYTNLVLQQHWLVLWANTYWALMEQGKNGEGQASYIRYNPCCQIKYCFIL